MYGGLWDNALREDTANQTIQPGVSCVIIHFAAVWAGGAFSIGTFGHTCRNHLMGAAFFRQSVESARCGVVALAYRLKI